MNDHRCIHCNSVSPQHTRFCAVLQYGEPDVDYFTDPPDYFAPPEAPGADANRGRDEEIDSLRAEVAVLRDRAEAAARERDALRDAVREHRAACQAYVDAGSAEQHAAWERRAAAAGVLAALVGSAS